MISYKSDAMSQSVGHVCASVFFIDREDHVRVRKDCVGRKILGSKPDSAVAWRFRLTYVFLSTLNYVFLNTSAKKRQ